MIEHIFWDDEEKEFISWGRAKFEDVEIWKQIDPITKEARLYDSFNYIGLNDINNNKIYADCSIVEFTASGSHGYTQLKGYFHFLKEDLKYIIKTFTHGSFDFNKQLYKNFKIIDTIQENKLGLTDGINL